ncbi:hypothetical protein [Actinomadura parmotrematis]|uniref:Uncharacterized protein n=1 Tax=Actinomadura parmotrematis TaxID=2864039 RepID=A0ABS7G0L6_9ACTN|nr:hypothetical protein [Actinomadura parmotrematis]MBW8485935.1 hypothetical protein [Actinomadura parmotrematis]
MALEEALGEVHELSVLGRLAAVAAESAQGVLLRRREPFFSRSGAVPRGIRAFPRLGLGRFGLPGPPIAAVVFGTSARLGSLPTLFRFRFFGHTDGLSLSSFAGGMR